MVQLLKGDAAKLIGRVSFKTSSGAINPAIRLSNFNVVPMELINGSYSAIQSATGEPATADEIALLPAGTGDAYTCKLPGGNADNHFSFRNTTVAIRIVSKTDVNEIYTILSEPIERI